MRSRGWIGCYDGKGIDFDEVEWRSVESLVKLARKGSFLHCNIMQEKKREFEIWLLRAMDEGGI